MTRMPKLKPASASATMACDEAFRAIARQYVQHLRERHRGTCAGKVEALHEMRIALTRLRASIAFFSPMLAGADQGRISAELKWLNAHLGMVRDLDVAIGRLVKTGGRPADVKIWKQERAACQRHLTRALRSMRYQRLIRDISAWIEEGTWSTKRAKEIADRRRAPIGEYGTQKLLQWRNKLVKKSSRLEEVGARRRHRVRLLNKKLTYALDAVASLLADDGMAGRQAALEQLRRAQKALGQLNDDARYRALARTLHNGKAAALDPLGSKQKKRLLHKAAEAYEEFARLKPFRTPQISTGDSRAGAQSAKSH